MQKKSSTRPVLSPNCRSAAEMIRHRQPQVTDRRLRLELNVPVALTHAAADGDDRQRIAGVPVGVAHAAAVEDQRVIEQRAVAVRRRAQLLEELREQRM